jgi:periodic tryptophan protein 1
MISTATWVKRGVAKCQPSQADLSEDEYRALVERLENNEDNGAHDELAHAAKPADSVSSPVRKKTKRSLNKPYVLPKPGKRQDKKKATIASNGPSVKDDSDLLIYNLDTYDDDEIVGEENENQTLPIFANVKGLMYHASNDEDPYIVLKDEADECDEKDELEIRPDDLLLVCGRTEDDLSHLEVYVYEENEDNLYVHHDVMLPAFPICTEWLDFDTKSRESDVSGNFIAVGTFRPQIEVWDLNIMDPFYPYAILGEKRKDGRRQADSMRHRDAVLSLSWNKQHR